MAINKDIYKRKTQHEHILTRPNTYIGSVDKTVHPMFIEENGSIVLKKDFEFTPGLFKIFDEIIVNAIDNKIRDPSMSYIKVYIKDYVIRVKNDGHGIPVEQQEDGIYIPEFVFGYLLTSSNYDDTTDRLTGGVNGIGAKATNIFSSHFEIETVCAGKKFKQVFNNNMYKRSEPIITTVKVKDYTQITFKPDLTKFAGVTSLTEITPLLNKRVYDIAGCNPDIKVYLNDELIKIKSFTDYIRLYGIDEIYASLKSKQGTIPYEIYIVPSTDYFQVTFVNSICTYDGGSYEMYVVNQIVNYVRTKLSKSPEFSNIKPGMIKGLFGIFINAMINRPEFTSQSKEKLTSQVKWTIPDSFLDKVYKAIVNKLKLMERDKMEKKLLKSTPAKQSNIKIPKLDDAIKAGTKDGYKCTLILTEGDSAKAFAVNGLGVIGHDYYGVFPLKGKLLNVRTATIKQLLENVEINTLKKIVGLVPRVKYNKDNIKTLRYGKIMLLADNDLDGSHIRGLILNFIENDWPELLGLGFVVDFITAIVKARKGKVIKSFYTIPEFTQWKDSVTDYSKWNISYYKGLGSSTGIEVKEYFSNLNVFMKEYYPITEREREMFVLSFDRKYADERKKWLTTITDDTYLDTSKPVLTFEDFIDKSLILYSYADNVRSIPSVVDGFKPSQRKILFACFKKPLGTTELSKVKVAQLAGYISEQSAYHHGEASLNQTIISMTFNFTGTNNLNLLTGSGQMGTRLLGGDDSASPRYVYTYMNSLTKNIFIPEDNNILEYIEEDNSIVEPKWYIPIIPMILVNGARGIGTGWSTVVPNYNPKDIISILLSKLDPKNTNVTTISPYYSKFTGRIEVLSTKIVTYGIITKIKNGYHITELPIGTWTSTYVDWLKSKDIVPINRSGVDTVDISFQHDNVEDPYSYFNLTTSIPTTNMVCFDAKGYIKKYNTIYEIIDEFYTTRIECYKKRKIYLLQELNKKHLRLSNKVRFILEVIKKTIKINNVPKDTIISKLEDMKFDKLEGTYDYLLNIQVYQFTKENVEKIKTELDELEREIEGLKEKTERTMYKEELLELRSKLKDI